ncbi:MAG: FKBP-type peptidyl-prolyl cis-trans isomerase [Planctomycetaceae bacterium]
MRALDKMLCCCLCTMITIGCTAPGQDVDENAVPEGPSVKTAIKTPETSGENNMDSDQEFTSTDSGLKYRILTASEGRKPTAADTVRCHYRGWLDNGKEFDSSYDRGEPAEFPLNGVIPGWTEGLQLIGENGKIELEIPYQLGYGERGFPPDIPGKSTLHFEVELIKIL